MLDLNNYDLNPIGWVSIDQARERFSLTKCVLLTYEPGDTTRYRICLHENHDKSLFIEHHPAYGGLWVESQCTIAAPADDHDRIEARDLEPISKGNVHTSHMLAGLLNHFLSR